MFTIICYRTENPVPIEEGNDEHFSRPYWREEVFALPDENEQKQKHLGAESFILVNDARELNCIENDYAEVKRDDDLNDDSKHFGFLLH